MHRYPPTHTMSMFASIHITMFCGSICIFCKTLRISISEKASRGQVSERGPLETLPLFQDRSHLVAEAAVLRSKLFILNNTKIIYLDLRTGRSFW